MFFDDPVAAFANMAKGLKPDGRIVFPAWAPAFENPWFLIPRDAAIARLGKPLLPTLSHPVRLHFRIGSA